MLNCSYETFLLCQMLWLGYQNGSISIEEIEEKLIDYFGKENFEKILKNFEKMLDKSKQM